MSRALIIVLALIVVGAAGYLIYQNQTEGEALEINLENKNPLNLLNKNEVKYTNEGYSPNSIKIKKDETVTWKNESNQTMWTASAMHPSHAVYPTTGGCIASTFDACQGIQPGDSWSFKFEQTGTWKYHNHTNPTHFGEVVVE